MLQTGVSYTLFAARQMNQKGIVRWSWKEMCITSTWDSASWWANNSCKRCCFLFYFRLGIVSA